MHKHINTYMRRVFANVQEDLGSILGRVIPKTKKCT